MVRGGAGSREEPQNIKYSARGIWIAAPPCHKLGHATAALLISSGETSCN
jgi:hypothetical protein